MSDRRKNTPEAGVNAKPDESGSSEDVESRIALARILLLGQGDLRLIQPRFDAWRQEFLGDCQASPTARSTLNALRQHDAEHVVLWLLFLRRNYADQFRKMRQDVRAAANRLERLNRAIVVAQQRKSENDPRAPMFVQRAVAALKALLDMPYAFAKPPKYRMADDLETFGDAANAYPQLRTLSPEQLRIKARILDGRQFLFMASLHAEECGVTLGAARICALAACAGRAPSRASIKRFFSELRSKPEVIQEFRSQLPVTLNPLTSKD